LDAPEKAPRDNGDQRAGATIRALLDAALGLAL
jgi:hypothetical protein